MDPECSTGENILNGEHADQYSMDMSGSVDGTHYDITVNGEIIKMKDNGSQHIFVDIFNYINFDLSKPQGTIALKLNGKSAAFTDKIQQGDIAEIYWKK
jgi:hypothetical protein